MMLQYRQILFLLCFAKCFIENETASSLAPKLGYWHRRMAQDEGTKLKLLCTLQRGSKPVVFEWRRNGEQMSESNGDVLAKYKIVHSEDDSLLTIYRLTTDFGGNFSCTARNDIGVDTQNTLLTVQAAPKIALLALRPNPDEGAKVKIFCSTQSGAKPLTFEWFHGERRLYTFDHGDITTATAVANISILSTDEESILTIGAVRRTDSGTYMCIVTNAIGSDRQSVSLTVKVPPSWIVEPKDVHTNKNEADRLECKADGSPKPTVKWITAKGITIESEYLDVSKHRSGSNIDTYECIADNGVGEPLRKSVKVSFMVPVKFDEKFATIKVKRGESARLVCNATGDQPLNVLWTRGNVKFDKLGSNYEIIDTDTDDGRKSELFVQTTQISDAGVYKCFAENEHGKDERTIKLEVVEVPDAPKSVRAKEVWSRTVSVVWTDAFTGNLPITKYTVQYWRYQSAPHRLHELTVPGGAQTSIFIKDLSPGQAYELSVIAENEIGKSSASSPITFTTGEEEPSAPPNDIAVEPLGPSTIRVTWRSPPIENWNGEIKGYYLGYRKTREPNHPYVYTSLPAHLEMSSSLSSMVRPTSSTFKKEITFHEHFIRQLAKGTEYTIVIKAYNSAGSGPQSHEILAHTFDGDLPPTLQLAVIDTTEDTVLLRWHQRLQGVFHHQSSSPITSYSIHYQKEGEQKWKDVPIVPAPASTSAVNPTAEPNAFLNSYSFVLEGLQPNLHYKIYVTAINRFGVGDPSNVIAVRTVSGLAVMQHEILRSTFNDGPYYLQPMFVWPVLIASVIVVVVMVIAYACVRKTRNEVESAFALDAATLNKRLSAAYNVGTTPRYMDFQHDKTANKTLMMGTEAEGGAYPLPYATLPMGGIGGENKPWDRPLPNPTLKKNSHIYDQPH